MKIQIYSVEMGQTREIQLRDISEIEWRLHNDVQDVEQRKKEKCLFYVFWNR